MNCSGKGYCRTSSGECDCATGYLKPDCKSKLFRKMKETQNQSCCPGSNPSKEQCCWLTLDENLLVASFGTFQEINRGHVKQHCGFDIVAIAVQLKAY